MNEILMAKIINFKLRTFTTKYNHKKTSYIGCFSIS